MNELTKDDLKAQAVEVLESYLNCNDPREKDNRLKEIKNLSPILKAYIVRSPHFENFVHALMLDAVLGKEGMTKTQLRALELFTDPRRKPASMVNILLGGKGDSKATIDVTPENED